MSRALLLFWLGLDEVVAAGRVVGVQVLVAHLSARPVGEELCVEFQHERDLVRLVDRQARGEDVADRRAARAPLT